jgi:hypothetical protein
MQECIICFEDIENNSNTNNLYLECCNNYVHENCLQLWITSNIDKNKDIDLCIYCKKNNNYITNIINNYKNLIPNNEFTDIIISNNNNNNQIIIAQNIPVNKNLSSCLSIFMGIIIIIFFICYLLSV